MTVEARAFTLIVCFSSIVKQYFSLLDPTNGEQIAGVLACAILLILIILCARQDDKCICSTVLIQVRSRAASRASSCALIQGKVLITAVHLLLFCGRIEKVTYLRALQSPMPADLPTCSKS